MKNIPLLFFSIAFIFSIQVFAQGNQPNVSTQQTLQTQNPIENISVEISRIAKSVEALNLRLKNFSDTFSSNQGLRLTDKQQKLLAAFEFLNRAEQRLATLQKLKIDLSEKQTSTNTKIATVENNLRQENIDRSIAITGSTNAEEIRSNRRQLLYKQKSELNELLNEIRNTMSDTDAEIRQTVMFLKNIRQRLFPEIEKEISDL
jgi:predicted  nucleic acid-binding Zn-ribbon protein